jgi:hypothetical protein
MTMNSATNKEPTMKPYTISSHNARTGDKLLCEGERARIHCAYPSKNDVVVRWYATGTFSRLSDDVLADCKSGW